VPYQKLLILRRSITTQKTQQRTEELKYRPILESLMADILMSLKAGDLEHKDSSACASMMLIRYIYYMQIVGRLNNCHSEQINGYDNNVN
jgi:hypothetical protein